MKRSGLPKYVTSFRDRHGKWRYRARRRRHPDHYFAASPATDAFLIEYQRWLAGEPEPPTIGETRTIPGSVSALIARYYRSGEHAGLKPSTQATYRGILENFRKVHGEKRWAHLRRKDVRHLITDKAATPAAANNLRRMLRILARFAMDEEWRDDDPTARVKGIKYESSGFHEWSDAEIEIFEKRWPIDSKEHLAFALCLYTGQRRGDVIRMGRQHIRDGKLWVKQEKTRSELLIPIHRRLQAVLEAHVTDNMTFLTTAYGAPFSPAGFGNWFRETCNEAGLKGCSAHGLRKAAARRLIEAGCSTKIAAAITGHKTLRQLEVYIRGANQVALAEQGIRALEKTEREQNLANPETGLDKVPRKVLKTGE